MNVRTIEDGEIITEAGLYGNVPISRYHGGDLCDGSAISSSGLRTIFTESELDYWINSPLNPNRVPQPDKQHFSIGRAVHHLALGEAHFGKHFVVLPDEFPDFKTKAAREWRDQQIAAGKTVLTRKDLEDIRGMAGLQPWQKDLEDCGLLNNALIRAGVLSGLIEHTLAWRDPDTGVWLLSRPDSVPGGSDVADLKTTADVSDRGIANSIAEFRYDMQAALFRMLAKRVLDMTIEHFSLVFVGKKPPYSVRVVELHHEDMDAAEADLKLAIHAFARGIQTGTWPAPGGTQTDARFVRVPDWSRKSADARHQSLSLELEAAGLSPFHKDHAA